MTLYERFMAQVHKDASAAAGYGRVFVARRMVMCHVLSFELHRDVVPSKVWVLHACDTPLCVNPEHLRLGTPAENSADMVARGRQVRGERVASSKLTEADVLKIRELYATGTVTQAELARSFGVDPSLISPLVRGKIWKHLRMQQRQ